MSPTETDLVEEVVQLFARERPDIAPETLRTVCRIIVAGRLLEQRAAALLRSSRLNYTDFDILGMLRVNGEPYQAQPQELVRRVMISSGAMTTALGRLENAGYVTRRVDPDDRRIKWVILTAEGKAVIDDALTRRFGDAGSALDHLTSRDFSALDRILKGVAGKLA